MYFGRAGRVLRVWRVCACLVGRCTVWPLKERSAAMLHGSMRGDVTNMCEASNTEARGVCFTLLSYERT